MEARGLPVDAGYLGRVRACWPGLRRHYIDRDDEFHLYDDNGSFRQDRFVSLIEERGWVWPQTETGKPELKSGTLGKQCRKHPELKRLQRLRDCVSELRLGAFLNTIGADGASRCSLAPFGPEARATNRKGGTKPFIRAAELDARLYRPQGGLGG